MAMNLQSANLLLADTVRRLEEYQVIWKEALLLTTTNSNPSQANFARGSRNNRGRGVSRGRRGRGGRGRISCSRGGSLLRRGSSSTKGRG